MAKTHIPISVGLTLYVVYERRHGLKPRALDDCFDGGGSSGGSSSSNGDASLATDHSDVGSIGRTNNHNGSVNSIDCIGFDLPRVIARILRMPLQTDT